MIFFPNDLRKGTTFHFPSAHSTRLGKNSLILRGILPWNNLPRVIKESLSDDDWQARRGLPTFAVTSR